MLNPPHRKVINNNCVFLDVRWFKRQGIIVCQDLFDDSFRFYIGLEEMHFTDTEVGDILGIMRYGSTFPFDVGMVLFPNIDYKKDSYKQLWPEDLI